MKRNEKKPVRYDDPSVDVAREVVHEEDIQIFGGTFHHVTIVAAADHSTMNAGNMPQDSNNTTTQLNDSNATTLDHSTAGNVDQEVAKWRQLYEAKCAECQRLEAELDATQRLCQRLVTEKRGKQRKVKD